MNKLKIKTLVEKKNQILQTGLMREKSTFSNIAKGSSFFINNSQLHVKLKHFERKKARRYERKTCWFIGYYGFQVEVNKVVDKELIDCLLVFLGLRTSKDGLSHICLNIMTNG